jgi:2-polyprenyl-3-methyl-5-hydroxy-6-metoxy-1,4-benzoquinol methylase
MDDNFQLCIMNTQQAYNAWAFQYDTNKNKTRDLEAKALRKTLENISFQSCLEIGCGTGKNTEWLIQKAEHVTAVDLSDEMIAKAKAKDFPDKVEFKQADITKEWVFTNQQYDLISFSLVLEHIENLEHIFKESSALLNGGGYVYVGELHPYKQYAGTKARFETEQGIQVLECFNHNISDFINAAKKFCFALADIDEYFDDDDKTKVPRILTILLKKI